MAKAWPVTDLRPNLSLATVARRVLAVRIAELYSYAPFIHDPLRVTELHDMRIAAKRLRYTLEIFRVCFEPALGPLLNEVKEVQELLGQIHDADVLIPLLEERLTALAQANQQALVVRLQAETREAKRLTMINQALAPASADPRLGIYALLGRTAQRRRRHYADFLELWNRLEAQQVRDHLIALTLADPLAPASQPAAD